MKLPAVDKTIPKCKLTIMNAGFCKIKKSHLLKGADSSVVRVPALFFLIEHPDHGYILFDTGYSTRYFAATNSFPFSLMNKMTPVKITEKDNAISQLYEKNITAKDIQTVLLSHLHADHAGGIADFNHATIYVDRKEWLYCQQNKYKLLFKGYLKQLYENINLSSLKQLDFQKDGQTYGPFSNAIDLLEDGTLILVPLPGHTIGQFGLLMNVSDRKRYFLISDSVYVRENYREDQGGSFLSKQIHFDQRQYERNFNTLNQLEVSNPDLVILPSHDPKVYQQFI